MQLQMSSEDARTVQQQVADFSEARKNWDSEGRDPPSGLGVQPLNLAPRRIPNYWIEWWFRPFAGKLDEPRKRYEFALQYQETCPTPLPYEGLMTYRNRLGKNDLRGGRTWDQVEKDLEEFESLYPLWKWCDWIAPYGGLISDSDKPAKGKGKARADPWDLLQTGQASTEDELRGRSRDRQLPPLAPKTGTESGQTLTLPSLKDLNLKLEAVQEERAISTRSYARATLRAGVTNPTRLNAAITV